MRNDVTTPSANEPGKRTRRQLRRRRPLEQVVHRPRPLWQALLRGALYAAGSGAVTLFTAWIQHQG